MNRQSSAPRRLTRRAVITGTATMMAAAVAALPGPVASAASNGVPSWVPKSVQAYYPGYQYFAKLQKSPYPNYQPPAAPWTFCYNTSYLGNDFQEGVVSELKKLAAEYHKAGLAKAQVLVTNSNGSAALELSQLNSLVQDGCSVIFGLPASATALCSAISRATAHNVLYVSVDSPVYCDNAMNVSWNGYWAELVGAQAVLKSINYKGNIVEMTGIPGVASAVAEVAADKTALAGHPGVHVLGQVNGEWTPSVAHTAMAQFLATHPQPVAGVIDAGAEDVAAEQALAQAGRPVAKVNSITTECSILAYWKQHPQALTLGTSQSPAAATYEAFLVAVRMLAGQKPDINTMFYPVPTVTHSNFSSWYKPSMTVQSSCIPSGPGTRAVPDSYFNAFFKGGSTPKLMPKP